MIKDQFKYYECDRCATRIKKDNTYKQDGLRVCKGCFDDKPKVKPLNLKFGTPRSNHLTITAVYEATIFSITAAGGITPSHSLSSEYTYSGSLDIANVPSNIRFGSAFYMKIVGSGGAIDITANPQIVAGRQNDLLVLDGTSDTNTVTIDNGTGVSLIEGSIVLGNGDKLSLVYNGTLWQEVSRYIEPIYI